MATPHKFHMLRHAFHAEADNTPFYPEPPLLFLAFPTFWFSADSSFVIVPSRFVRTTPELVECLHSGLLLWTVREKLMDNLRILVVGGHPADVFDHCGGTMVHHIRRGDQVTCLALTHGLRIHDVVIQEELRFQERTPDPERLEKLLAERAKVKHKEVVDACAILGITDVRFLNYDDIVLLENPQMVAAVAKVIRDVRPNVVITHHPRINGAVGSHHGETGKIVLNAVHCAGTFDPDDPSPAWRTAQVFYMSPEEASFMYSPLGATSGIFCDYYVDISDVVDLKVKALATMASQQYSIDYARKAVEGQNGKDGMYIGVAYAESFVRNSPEIGDFLEVSERRMRWANEPEHDRRVRTDVISVTNVQAP